MAESPPPDQKETPQSSGREDAAPPEQEDAQEHDDTPKAPDDFGPAVEAAKAAKRLQDTADSLRRQASLIRDPAERERLVRAAYETEVQAHGQSRKACAMASGWGQGAVAGAGVASAVGMGLGNLVGVLLSGVTAVPGVLVGSGVGAVHGPWFSLGGGGKQGDGRDETKEGGNGGDDSDNEEMHRAIVEAARQAEAEEGGCAEPAQKA